MVVYDAHVHSNSDDDSDFLDDDYEQDIEEDYELFSRFVVKESKEDQSSNGDQSESDGLSSREESSNDNVHFEVGFVFSSKDELKGAIKEYGIKNGKKLKMKKNDKQRVRVICEGSCERNSCPWVLLATHDNVGSGWVVKTHNSRHTCAREQSNRFASATWLAKKFEDDFRINPKWKVSDFIEFVRRQCGIYISTNVACKAKRKAKKNILGSVDRQYARLWDYCDELKRRNANSTVLLKTNFDGDGAAFQRIYICFGVCKNGLLEGCRQVLGLDVCHLNGPHKGQLLTAIGIDANNDMFPVAYAVVEVENQYTWSWFLQILIEDLGIDNGCGWVWITDQQKGLIQAIEELTPNADHRHCVRHFHNNFKVAGNGGLGLKNRLWSCARASNIRWFESEMEALKIESKKAYDWLISKPAQHWSRSHFTTHSKCDMLLNNLCESFNAVILNARDKPILTMLEMIRHYLMVKLVQKRDTRWAQSVGPRVHRIVEKNMIKSSHFIAEFVGEGAYKIRTVSGNDFVVDLNRHTCTCRRWDLSGIPCNHAMSAIARDPYLTAQQYVHPCYKRAAYNRTYQGSIAPMPGQEHWLDSLVSNVSNPPYHKQPGRPKKLRKKSLAEQIPVPDRQARKLSRKYVTLKCGICRTSGHNSRKCPHRGEGSNSGHQAEAEGVPPQNPSHVDQGDSSTIQPSFDMNEP